MHATSFARKTRLLAIIVSFLTIGGLFVVAMLSPAMHLLPMRFNPFIVVSALTVAVNLGLLGYFTLKASRTDERVWLTLYLTVVVIYSASELLQRLAATPQAALFWYYASTPVVALPAAIFLFALAYTNQSERRYPGTVAALLMGALLLGFFYTYTNLVFVSDARAAILMPWGYDFRKAIGPAVGMSLLWNDMLIILALSRLISFRRHTRNAILRKQSLLFIFAVSIPLATGTVTNIILPVAGLANIIPVGPIFAIPAGLLLVYGVLRYQLLSISPTLFSNTVLAIMQEAVVVTDTKFNVVFVNEEAENLLGIKAEASTKSSLLGMISPGTLPKFQQAFATMAESGVVNIDHIDVANPKGKPVPVKVRSSQLKLSDFAVNVMALTDISDELHTQNVIEHEVTVRTEQLNRARAYLVSSINSLEQGFVLVDHKSKIELANGLAAKLFGVSGDSASSQPLATVVAGTSWNIDLAKLVAVVLDSKHHRQIEAAAKDGSFYQVYVTPVLAHDRELGATILIENVTERKILDRSKEEFFSIASHELRTPLTAVRGNTEMIKDYFPDAMKDESLAGMINDMHESSVRLIAIVNDFLDSSALEQGKMAFELKPVAVQPSLEAARDDLAMLTKQQDNLITLKSLDKLPKVMADEGRLRQIFYNLLSNANKYSEHATITVEAEAAGANLKLRFTDTGKGMLPEAQKLLFRKFQQAGDPLTRDNTKGTGLGLYISRLLAKGMHGSVELEWSEVGKGSAFVVTLPLAAAK